MRVKVHLSIGLSGADIEDEIEIDETMLEGFNDDDRAQIIEEEVREYVFGNYVEWSYKIVEESQEQPNVECAV